MALILLIVIGATMGWLASIVTRSEENSAILIRMAVGVTGALIAGIIANKGAFLGGLSLLALAAALGGSLAALAVCHFIMRRTANG